MMDRVRKQLKKLPPKEKRKLNRALTLLRDPDGRGSLDMKKLRGSDLYRVRVGSYGLSVGLVATRLLCTTSENAMIIPIEICNPRLTTVNRKGQAIHVTMVLTESIRFSILYIENDVFHELPIY
jgi:mRNA-degrading endonuclease RelE of RelBE toxin-antitoxin system